MPNSRGWWALLWKVLKLKNVCKKYINVNGVNTKKDDKLFDVLLMEKGTFLAYKHTYRRKKKKKKKREWRCCLTRLLSSWKA